MQDFYAYLHARPNTVDASGIFYVGKGTLERTTKLKRPHNPYHSSILAKHGIENILVTKIECSSEEIAFELEKGLIKCFKRMGVKLANMSDGGEGNAGVMKGTKQSAEHVLKRVASSKRERPVICIESGREFKSVTNAARWCFEEGHSSTINPCGISRNAIGKMQKSASGFHWKFKE
jgi:hypothetical protein